MSGKFAGQEKWYIFLTLSPERRAEHQSAQMSKITKWRLNPVCHRMLYGCTHMTTVGIKGKRWSMNWWATAKQPTSTL